MPRKVHLITLLLCVALASCEGRRSTEYQGGLYFGQGAYLMRYSLQDGNLSVVGHLGDTVIREVSPLRSEHLLIAESAWANGRSLPRISWFGVETGESVDLYAGFHARYLASPNVIVYDDGADLYAVPQHPDSDNTVIFNHEEERLTRLLEVSPGLLLFETGSGADPTIRSWDAHTGDLEKLDGLTATCRLQGAVWVDVLERVVCKRRSGAVSDAQYVLASLDGAVDRVLEMPSDHAFRALTYIADQNALVLQESWGSLMGKESRYAIWVHDIESGENHRLPGNVNLGISAVYAEF